MRILVADDDPVMRYTLIESLSQLGHEAVEVSDGPAAWEAMQATDAPALVLLDWMMPEPSGVEICQLLRATPKRPYQYVILLTGRDTVEDVVEGIEAGADDYLRKPFDMRELRARVRAGERMLALQDELLARATTDELTGLLNRRGLLQRLDHELSLVARDSRPLSLLVVDIDNFKSINDAHGHPVGDEVLKEVSLRMRAQLRAYDDLGRHGGEEFAIILPTCGANDALAVAERVRRAICDVAVQTTSGEIPVTVSVGAASADAGSLDTAALLGSADQALYAAKRNGRNRIEASGLVNARPLPN